MITAWNQIVPDAIRNLKPLHQEIVFYVMNLPGKRKPSGAYTKTAWRLSRDQYFTELGYALDEIRLYLQRHGLTAPGDLTLE
jgi:hypothetical protein